MARSTKRRFGTCSKDCYGACVFESLWDDTQKEQKLLRVMPLKSHPFTQGTFCAKMTHRERLIYNPKRLKHALIRNGVKGESHFQEIPLEQALECTVSHINAAMNSVGGQAILSASYSGNAGLISNYAPLRFFNLIGASHTIGGICNEGGNAGFAQLFGTYSTTNPFQLANPATHLIVVWGCNLSATNNHAYMLVQRAMSQGTKVIVVDTRCTNIAKKANLFLNPNPGSDDVLAYIIIARLMRRGAMDQNFIDQNTENSEEILEKIKNITPAIESEMLKICEVKTETIEGFVDLLTENKEHTVFNIGYGLQKYQHGGRVVQAIALIQIFLGNLGKHGTGIIYSQSAFNRPYTRPLSEFLAQEKQMPISEEIQLISLTDALETGKYKVLFIYNFNPVTSLPNQIRLREALSRKDIFVIQIDLYENETSLYADLIFPAKFDLETDDLFSNFYLPGISINEAGPCPYPDCLSNWEFFQKLYDLLSNHDRQKTQDFQPSQQELYQNCLHMLPPKIKSDIHDKGYSLFQDEKVVPFSNLRFPTSTGKIALKNIFLPQNWHENLEQKKETNEFFSLITPAHESFLHSQLGLLHPDALQDFECVFLNPEDMASLSLASRDLVKVTGSFGNAVYRVIPDPSLKHKVAMIYSGPSAPSNPLKHANLFTPPDPEILGKSGSYNAGRILVQKSK